MKHSKIIFLILLAVFIYSCEKHEPFQKRSGNDYSETDTFNSVTGDMIIMRLNQEPSGLNPFTSKDEYSGMILSYIFEPLMKNADISGSEVNPWVAESFEESQDHLTYTYSIDKNVTFSDGTKLTTNDIIFTFKLLLNRANGRAVYENDLIDKVEIVDNNSLKFRIKFKKVYYNNYDVINSIKIVPKHIWDPEGYTDKYSFEDCKDSANAFNNLYMKKIIERIESVDFSRDQKYLIGTGPYILDKWDTGNEIHLKRNENYWRTGLDFGSSYVNKIIIKIIPDDEIAIIAAKNNEIDLMNVQNSKYYINEFSTPEKFNLRNVTGYYNHYHYIGYNHTNLLFSDLKTRQALAYLVNKSAIIEKIHFGLAEQVNSHYCINDKIYRNIEITETPYDLEKAKNMLKEAGWADNNGDGILDKEINGKNVEFKFTYLNNGNQTRRNTLLVIRDDLKKAGIQADITDIEWSIFLEMLNKGQFEGFIGSWVLSYPPDYYNYFHSSVSNGNGSIYVRYKNPVLDSLCEIHLKETNENNRILISKKIQKVLYDEQVYTFLFSTKIKYIYSNRFKNARFIDSPYLKFNLCEWWVPTENQKYK